ncbi:uncharacterized protein N7479_009160 [Penicillium vulpinum]|uniref:uncharacterized protein n=1 Tax=Penicillium vulpinum TaxID=29845 RepID=UPI0025491670|nr:uncharacterized protein N7479_009160 [Penicillium vulpinum]KAJ5950747.1 hypothetical protein N7479_009160 [Penicillium vulpinum]
MYLAISPALALLFLQVQALPTNKTLENFVTPTFIPIPSGPNYKLCTQGCWPAALLCSFDNCFPSPEKVTPTNHQQSPSNASPSSRVVYT